MFKEIYVHNVNNIAKYDFGTTCYYDVQVLNRAFKKSWPKIWQQFQTIIQWLLVVTLLAETKTNDNEYCCNMYIMTTYNNPVE